MTIQERYKQLIDFYADGNKRSFAKKIGVAASSIENIVGARGTNPGFEVIQKTLFAFENMNARWLILGIGEIEGGSREYPKVSGLEIAEDKGSLYLSKNALEMIRDLSAENALLKSEIDRYEREIKEKR